MKKQLLILLGVILFSGWIQPCAGQSDPFALKHKTTAGRSFMPQPVLPVPTVAQTPARLLPGLQSPPKTRPLHILRGLPQPDGLKTYGSDGRLIAYSGEVPGCSLADRDGSGPTEACYRYLEAIAPLTQVGSPRDEFRIIRVHEDELGMIHIRMRQVYNEIPVYGSDFYLHGTGTGIRQFNGSVFPSFRLETTSPGVSATDAAAVAGQHAGERTAAVGLNEVERSLLRYDGPVSELIVYPDGNQTRRMVLAWHITLRPNFIERWEYFIDASDGRVIHFFNNTPNDGGVLANGPDLNGVNRQINCYQEGNSYYVLDITRPMFNYQNKEGTIRVYDANYTSPFVQGFNPPLAYSSNNSWSPKVISAQFNSGVTYEHHRTVNNRNSWNNQGGSLISVINATTQNGGGLDNAFWNGICLIYGNGDQYFKPLQGALDVVAHEIGHAYDEGSANLEYQNQSGAINEAFADIAAVVVERLNWKCGEDIVKPGVFPGGCLRDMSNPHNGGSSLSDPGYQPAHVSEMYTGTEDNGGVHINSGIINFAFYKFVTATSMDKGEKVFLRALFNYLTRSSQFIDCRLAVIQAAKDLYGTGSAEVNAAMNAFDEVGITDGSGGNYQDPLPVNPGQDYILSYDLVDADPATFYVSSTTGTDYVAKSQTPSLCKPSITDDGTVAVFIGSDKKIHAFSLTGDPQETIIQNEPIWSNVAISKDGTKLAAVTDFQDSSIYIYSYSKQQWIRAFLYNPTTQQGVVTYNVLYADALEWDYGGEYLIYDAYNQMNNSGGWQGVDYWDISFLRVWNNSANTWGDGAIFKMVSGIPDGVSIGNPSLSKNSPSVCAFDYFDGNTGNVSLLAANLETGDFVEVFNNGETLTYPNYSKLDNRIIFSAKQNDGTPVVAGIDMAPDKIHPASAQAWVVIPDGKWGVWFAQGYRPLAIPEVTAAHFSFYPNPARESITITTGETSPMMIRGKLTDLRGGLLRSFAFAAGQPCTVALGGLSRGAYLVTLVCDKWTETRKVLVH